MRRRRVASLANVDTIRTPAGLASLIATNIAPLAGIVVLGWSPSAVLASYFVDTFIALGGVVLLVMAHVTGNEHDRPLRGWKDWTKACAGLVLLGAIFGLPMAFPLMMVIGEDPALEPMFADRTFIAALALQALMSALTTARMHRMLKARSDDDRILARRFIFLVARWVAMFFAVVTGLAPLLGPSIGGALLVAIYAGASIYFELFPQAAERMVRGKDAKPIVYDDDLEARNRPRGSR